VEDGIGESLGSLPRYGDGKEPPPFALYHPLTSIAFSQDGKLVAAGGWDGQLKVWAISKQV